MVVVDAGSWPIAKQVVLAVIEQHLRQFLLLRREKVVVVAEQGSHGIGGEERGSAKLCAEES